MNNTIKILIVDDEPSLRRRLAEKARGGNREVTEAADAGEAIKLIQENDFAAIITDLRMETDTSGIDVLEAAKNKSPYTQVLIATAYGDKDISWECMNKGAFDYLERNLPGTDFYGMVSHKLDFALEFRELKLSKYVVEEETLMTEIKIMSYSAPSNILEVLQKIEFNHALDADDDRYVDTQNARGQKKTLKRLARKLGLDLDTGEFLLFEQKHVLFFGHTGSGKTTELRRYARELEGPERFFIVEVDIAEVLDRNNLKYADAFMAMAQCLLSEIENQNIYVEAKEIAAMVKWFDERVLSFDEIKDFRLEVETIAKVGADWPWLLQLFAKFTSAFKANTTYKESLRHVIRNTFSEFALAFNGLLRKIEKCLTQEGIAQRVLFIVDGTDKLRREDTDDLFLRDVDQLLAIDALVVWTAPLSLKYAGDGHVGGKLEVDLMLPMVKLFESGGNQRFQPGWEAMRAILLKRAARSLFDSEENIERLVEYSGGHPRELLRLLMLCCELAEDNHIDGKTVDAAINQLAAEYRLHLQSEDYKLLAGIEKDPLNVGSDGPIQKLLYNLSLLEYNDGTWRRCHPVIRTLEGYKRAVSEQKAGTSG